MKHPLNYHLPVLTGHTYQNPLPFTDGKEHTNPDPYVIKWCGTYYCYSSDEKGVNVSRSKDLTLWESCGFALSDPAYQNFWAPAVIYRNGRFYMYYSCERYQETEMHGEFLRLAVSDGPLGPFTTVKTFFEEFSIDAHPVVWGEDVYLFYSTNNIMGRETEFAGTGILVDRLVEMDRLEGNPKSVVTASLPQEVFAKNRFGDGRDWYTIEGACFVEHDDVCYLLYSANAYVNTDYFVGYSTAVKKADFASMDWVKYPDEYTWNPLLMRNGKVEGTGHNTVVKAPNLVDDWIVYHGRDAAVPIVEGTEQRVMRMDPIFYRGMSMETNGPSDGCQDAPALPAYEAELKSVRGLWLGDKVEDCYVLESWIQADRTTDGARYGLLLNYINEENWVKLLFNSGRNTAALLISQNGLEREAKSHCLPKGYDHTVPHLVEVKKTFNCYEVSVDNVSVFITETGMDNGRVGMVSYYHDTVLHSLSMTGHCGLRNKNLHQVARLFSFGQGTGTGSGGLNPVSAADTGSGIVPGSSRSFYMDRGPVDGYGYVEEFTIETLGQQGSFGIGIKDGNGEKETDGHPQPFVWEEAFGPGLHTVRIVQKEGKGWVTGKMEVTDVALEDTHMAGTGEMTLDSPAIRFTLDHMKLTGYKRTRLYKNMK